MRKFLLIALALLSLTMTAQKKPAKKTAKQTMSAIKVKSEARINPWPCDTVMYWPTEIVDDFRFQFLGFFCPMPNAPAHRIVLRNPTNGRFSEVPAGANNTVLGIDGTGTVNWQAPNVLLIPNATLSYTAVGSLPAGVRKVTVSGVTGVQSGDRVLLTPISSTPPDYGLMDATATATGTIEVTYFGPPMSASDSFNIPCQVTVFR